MLGRQVWEDMTSEAAEKVVDRRLDLKGLGFKTRHY
jgi:hypothetical protein